MAESFLCLPASERADALEVAAAALGRPAGLLEKDVWVVWTLNALFHAGFGAALTFKGGTSLSKVVRVIDRFSEDVDHTHHVRRLLPELAEAEGDPSPRSRSAATRIATRAKGALSSWVAAEARPALDLALAREGIEEGRVEVNDANLILL